jgi:hypothetical protein
MDIDRSIVGREFDRTDTEPVGADEPLMIPRDAARRVIQSART